MQNIREPPPVLLLPSILVQFVVWTLHLYMSLSFHVQPLWLFMLFWAMSIGISVLDILDYWSVVHIPMVLASSEAWKGNQWTIALSIIRLGFVGCLFVFGLLHTVFHYANGDYQPLAQQDEESPAVAPSSNSPANKKDYSLRDYYNRFVELLPYMWPSGDFMLKICLLLGFIMLALGRAVNVMVPAQYKHLINSLGGDGNGVKSDAVMQTFLFVGLRFLQGGVGLLSTVQDLLWLPVNQYTSRRVSIQLFEHLHNLSLRFHLKRKTGEILRIQDRGVSSILSLLRLVVFQILPTFSDIFFGFLYFWYEFDLYIASVMLTTMFSYIFATIVITEWRTHHRREAIEYENDKDAKAVDSLLNFETVKYYGAEEFEVSRYDQAVQRYQKAALKMVASLGFLNSAQNAIIQLGLLVGALVLVDRVIRGEVFVSQVVLFFTYVIQLYGPLNYFGTIYRAIQQNLIDMEKLFDLFQENVDINDAPDAQELKIKSGAVVFDNVSFAYDPRQPILHNVSFTVPGGTTLAIVGPTGSGKSTIFRLLFRFYDIDSGRILIDDQDIRLVKQKKLRQAIGVVPQDTVLFNDTIQYNIRYGKVSATDGQVEMAAKAAQIHDKILGFPDGYDTKVGERGLRLSGVAIARTILKNPPIVLLDEATSALDTNTERQIQTALNEMTINRTTIIVAHRLSTVVHADQIIVLKDGRVVERGSHAELLSQQDGVYNQMWQAQLTANNFSE